MKKILVFATNLLVCIGLADAAVRDGTNPLRTKSDRTSSQSRVATTNKRATAKTTVLTSRSTKPDTTRSASSARSVKSRNSVSQTKSILSRAGTSDTTDKKTMSDTRTGAEYEKCKNTYFACMDQFCTLKNNDYRRCSCSDRVFDMIDQRATLEDANEQLTVFTESLSSVGMTAAQATAMKQASEGENALDSTKSASKALLQAIMNSISGKDTNVGGKYSDLNSINISFDNANAFGMSDAGQAIAAYNGVALYSAVYPQCRQAVTKDCTDASLQRAVTAYLMAVEQDCNTVQSAIETTKKQLKSAVREGSAMLDLARVENRQKHNEYDLATCINEIEKAVLSEQVCGSNYRRCLDNGEYIDVSTGKPIAGVVDFANLGNLLTFADGVDAAKQKLSKMPSNRTFIQNFETKVKKFAEPALNKCTEQADIAWSDYLDKALLDIHYAQQSKVTEIKQACFDFVSSCYVNADKSITAAMQVLTSGNQIVVNPDKITLTDQMCTDYVASCDRMFEGDGKNGIIADYISTQTQTDLTTSCRAVVKQCFDKFGGTNYENFYYPHSGIFTSGFALDWFTLYDKTNNDTILSPCAKQLESITACSDPEIIESAFGGMDKYEVPKENDKLYKYGLLINDKPQERFARPSGIATEVYNQILSTLSTQCMNLNGRYIEYQNVIQDAIYSTDYHYNMSKPTCKFVTTFPDTTDAFRDIYGLKTDENICPSGYAAGVDIASWGICSCWGNGARRSEDGTTITCIDEYYSASTWHPLTPPYTTRENIICPPPYQVSDEGDCFWLDYEGGSPKVKLLDTKPLPKGI